MIKKLFYSLLALICLGPVSVQAMKPIEPEEQPSLVMKLFKGYGAPAPSPSVEAQLLNELVSELLPQVKIELKRIKYIINNRPLYVADIEKLRLDERPWFIKQLEKLYGHLELLEKHSLLFRPTIERAFALVQKMERAVASINLHIDYLRIRRLLEQLAYVNAETRQDLQEIFSVALLTKKDLAVIHKILHPILNLMQQRENPETIYDFGRSPDGTDPKHVSDIIGYYQDFLNKIQRFIDLLEHDVLMQEIGDLIAQLEEFIEHQSVINAYAIGKYIQIIDEVKKHLVFNKDDIKRLIAAVNFLLYMMEKYEDPGTKYPFGQQEVIDTPIEDIINYFKTTILTKLDDMLRCQKKMCSSSFAYGKTD